MFSLEFIKYQPQTHLEIVILNVIYNKNKAAIKIVI